MCSIVQFKEENISDGCFGEIWPNEKVTPAWRLPAP